MTAHWDDDRDYRETRDTQPGEWLIGSVRRNPEAFLVLAAGCALLLRGGRSYWRRHSMENYRGASMEVYGTDDRAETGQSRRGRIEAVREGLSEAAESAGDYVETMKDRVYDTASTYASAVTEFAEDGTRRISNQAARLGRQASRFGSQTSATAGRMLHEQPLAVAALGLAAGAAVAALLPRTDVEGRAFRPARDALADAASRAAGSVKEAAGEAGRRLQEGAAERGLSAEGLKDLARDAVETFSGSIKGEATENASPTSTTTGLGGGIQGGSIGGAGP